MRYLPLFVALALSAAASVTVATTTPVRVSVVCVGAFLVFVPGLLLVHVLALPDRLLALVVGLLAGPSFWVLVGTVQLFTGLWDPRATVLTSAGVFALLTLLLAVRGVRHEAAPERVQDVDVRGSWIEQYAVDDTD